MLVAARVVAVADALHGRIAPEDAPDFQRASSLLLVLLIIGQVLYHVAFLSPAHQADRFEALALETDLRRTLETEDTSKTPAALPAPTNTIGRFGQWATARPGVWSSFVQVYVTVLLALLDWKVLDLVFIRQ